MKNFIFYRIWIRVNLTDPVGNRIYFRINSEHSVDHSLRWLNEIFVNIYLGAEQSEQWTNQKEVSDWRNNANPDLRVGHPYIMDDGTTEGMRQLKF